MLNLNHFSYSRKMSACRIFFYIYLFEIPIKENKDIRSFSVCTKLGKYITSIQYPKKKKKNEKGCLNPQQKKINGMR